MSLFAALLVALFVDLRGGPGNRRDERALGRRGDRQGRAPRREHVSEAEVKRATAQQIAAAASESKQKAPKPGSKKYEELREAALANSSTRSGSGARRKNSGSRSPTKQIETELKTIKKTNFPTPKSLRRIPAEIALHPG